MNFLKNLVNNSKFYIFNNISSMIFKLICIILVYNISFNFKENKFYLKYLQKNLESNIQYSIDVLDKGKKCNKTYVTNKFIKFEGTDEGCDCNKNLDEIDLKLLYKRKCTSNEKKKYCKKIKSIDDKSLKIYKGKRFCFLSEDINELTYSDYLKNSVNKNENCKEGFKQCGILDSFNNKLCLPIKKKCPINFFSISNKEIIFDNNKSFYNVSLNNNEILYYSNEFENNKIIIELKLNEGKMCFDPKIKNLVFEKYFLYENEDFYAKNCLDGKFNNNYTLIDTINLKTLYKDNDLLDKIKKLPNYNENNFNEMFNLYSNNYFGYDKKNFFKENLPEKIKNILKNSKKLSKYQFYIKILLFPGFLYIILMCYLEISKKFEDHNSAKIILIKLIFNSINLVIVFLSFKSITTLNYFIIKSHGDELVNNIFDKHNKNLNKNIYFYLFIFILTLFEHVLIYLEYINLCIKQNEKQEKENNLVNSNYKIIKNDLDKNNKNDINKYKELIKHEKEFDRTIELKTSLNEEKKADNLYDKIDNNKEENSNYSNIL